MEKVWVIGGTSGIGAAIASEVLTDAANAKADVSVAVTDEHETDVTSMSRIRNYYSDFRPKYIVYCAGINTLMPASHFDALEAIRIMNVNAIGFMRVIAVVAHNMDMHQPRSVVAISSDAATHPMRNSMAYCASKAALSMAVRCAARELAPDVRINAVCPGPVADTPMAASVDEQVLEIKGWTRKQYESDIATGIPMGRRAEKQEIAQVVRDVLYGPQYLTGSIIEVNGAR